MAKGTGLGAGLIVNGYVLSNDIGAVTDLGGGPAPLVVTGIDKSAFERIGGTRDGRMNLNAFFNKAAGKAHPRFGALSTADQIATFHLGGTIAAATACLTAKQVNYDGNRGTDGAFQFDINEVGNGFGLEWGKQLTAGVRTDTGATNGTGVDFGTGSTSFGLQAYLQVSAFAGTDMTVKLQESSDNGAGDAWTDVTGGAFTQVTSGPTYERIATSSGLTVEQYLRVVTVTTGGFSSASIHVMVNRNDTSTVF